MSSSNKAEIPEHRRAVDCCVLRFIDRLLVAEDLVGAFVDCQHLVVVPVDQVPDPDDGVTVPAIGVCMVCVVINGHRGREGEEFF